MANTASATAWLGQGIITLVSEYAVQEGSYDIDAKQHDPSRSHALTLTLPIDGWYHTKFYLVCFFWSLSLGPKKIFYPLVQVLNKLLT